MISQLFQRYSSPIRICKYGFVSRSISNFRHADVNSLFHNIVQNNRAALAQGITLVESVNPNKRKDAENLLRLALSERKSSHLLNKSFRIGLTGPPGSGKSSFIEVFGKFLTAKMKKVAVLAVDPSSSKTGGSLLGDRTRMTELSRDPLAYIRPSPTSGTLGGVTRTTNEAIVLCEAAGYDVILIETVGVGQSEYLVSDMVDMFVLVIPPASGDELQGIKKGIVEMADLVLINKADGDLVSAAMRMQAEYTSALKLLHRHGAPWNPKVCRMSVVNEEGIDNVWNVMTSYKDIMVEKELFIKKRNDQYKKWMWNHVRDNIMQRFQNHPRVESNVGRLETAVVKGELTPGLAADELIKCFTGDRDRVP